MGQRRPIAFLLNGGLGNQLFQLAGALAICLRTGKPGLLIPVGYQGSVRSPIESQSRYVEIEEVVSEYDFLEIHHGDASQFRRRHVAGRVLSRVGLSRFSPSLIESGCRDGQWAGVGPATRRVRGFFRSASLVAEVWGALRVPLIAQIEKNSGPEAPRECVFHVRLGDYIEDEATRRVHGDIVNLSYLTQARDLMSLNSPVSVVSDSPEHAQQLLARAQIPSQHLGNQSDSPWRTLSYLSSAKHLVGSNSTLSWWGGWIGRSMGQETAVLPRTWFNAGYGACDPPLDFDGLIRI